jgi:hypothetical protein
MMLLCSFRSVLTCGRSYLIKCPVSSLPATDPRPLFPEAMEPPDIPEVRMHVLKNEYSSIIPFLFRPAQSSHSPPLVPTSRRPSLTSAPLPSFRLHHLSVHPLASSFLCHLPSVASSPLDPSGCFSGRLRSRLNTRRSSSRCMLLLMCCSYYSYHAVPQKWRQWRRRHPRRGGDGRCSSCRCGGYGGPVQ